MPYFLHFCRYCFSIPSERFKYTISSCSQVILWACLLPSITRAPSLFLKGNFSIAQSAKICKNIYYVFVLMIFNKIKNNVFNKQSERNLKSMSSVHISNNKYVTVSLRYILLDLLYRNILYFLKLLSAFSLEIICSTYRLTAFDIDNFCLNSC